MFEQLCQLKLPPNLKHEDDKGRRLYYMKLIGDNMIMINTA